MRSAVTKIIYAFGAQNSKLISFNFNQTQKAAYIKMTNLKKRNTLSLEALKNLQQAFATTEQSVKNKNTKIVILEGEGPVFSSGHDLKQLPVSDNAQKVFDECATLMKQIKTFPAPVLCVVNGIAAAGGFQMAMACDIVIATEKSSFSCPGIKWGLFCTTPGLQLVRGISSQKKANQMLLFGQQMSAHDAEKYGIINKVVAEDKLTETIQSYIAKVQKLSGEVLAFGKKKLHEQRQLTFDEAYQLGSKTMVQNIKTKQDCQEGLKAFAEKRHPVFKN